MQATMKNLKDQILTDDNAIMFCEICGAEYSADLGDYFMCPDSHKFECCGRIMILVNKKTIYEEVK